MPSIMRGILMSPWITPVLCCSKHLTGPGDQRVDDERFSGTLGDSGLKIRRDTLSSCPDNVDSRDRAPVQPPANLEAG